MSLRATRRSCSKGHHHLQSSNARPLSIQWRSQPREPGSRALRYQYPSIRHTGSSRLARCQPRNLKSPYLEPPTSPILPIPSLQPGQQTIDFPCSVELPRLKPISNRSSQIMQKVKAEALHRSSAANRLRTLRDDAPVYHAPERTLLTQLYYYQSDYSNKLYLNLCNPMYLPMQYEEKVHNPSCIGSSLCQ